MMTQDTSAIIKMLNDSSIEENKRHRAAQDAQSAINNEQSRIRASDNDSVRKFLRESSIEEAVRDAEQREYLINLFETPTTDTKGETKNESVND